ncbi:MAG: hypothetical protein LBK02_10470 [Treponema sp.]|nr:hypothetical protein [Treponema sp.]
MSKFRPGFTVFLIGLIFLVPVLAYPQNGKKGLEEFTRRLKDWDVSVEQGFLFSGPEEENETGAGKTGFSLLLSFPGNAGADGEAPDSGELPLMIAAFPLENGTPPGEDEPADGMSYPLRTTLALTGRIRARQAEGRGLPVDLLIALLGEQDIQAAGKLSVPGDTIEEPEQIVFWYFDFDRAPRLLRIRHGTSRTIAPLDALKGLPDLLGSLNIPYEFAVPFNELYKLGFAGGPEILRFTQEQEIRALVFSGSGALDTDAQGRISGDTLAELILDYAGSLEPPGENPDYHYIIIPLRNSHFFLSQDRIILLLLLIAALFFGGLLAYTKFRPPSPARILVFFRCFWVIPGLFLLFFAALEGAGLAASILAGKGENRVIMLYGWALWKIILGLGFFALISIPLGRYRISLRANFYGAAALLLIVLDTLAAAWLDICFVPFFTAAFLLIFLGACIKHPVPVYCCAALAPFYGFIAGIFSIRSGYGGLGEFLLSNRPFPAAMMILALLPFVLLFKRGIALSRREKPTIYRRLIPFFVLLGLALILGIILLIAAH